MTFLICSAWSDLKDPWGLAPTFTAQPLTHRPSWTYQHNAGLCHFCLLPGMTLLLGFKLRAIVILWRLCVSLLPWQCKWPLWCLHIPARGLHQRDHHKVTADGPCKALSLFRHTFCVPRVGRNAWHTPGRNSINVQEKGKQFFFWDASLEPSEHVDLKLSWNSFFFCLCDLLCLRLWAIVCGYSWSPWSNIVCLSCKELHPWNHGSGPKMVPLSFESPWWGAHPICVCSLNGLNMQFQ